MIWLQRFGMTDSVFMWMYTIYMEAGSPERRTGFLQFLFLLEFFRQVVHFFWVFLHEAP